MLVLRRFSLFAALSLSVVGLVACPSSEDDGPLCNDSKCGPGICLQFCGADAAKEGAATEAGSDGTTEASSDAGTTDADAAADAVGDVVDGG